MSNRDQFACFSKIIQKRKEIREEKKSLNYSTIVLITVPSSKCNFVKFREDFPDACSLFMEISFEVNLILSCGSSSARTRSSTFLWTALTPIPGLQIHKVNQNECNCNQFHFFPISNCIIKRLTFISYISTTIELVPQKQTLTMKLSVKNFIEHFVCTK